MFDAIPEPGNIPFVAAPCDCSPNNQGKICPISSTFTNVVPSIQTSEDKTSYFFASQFPDTIDESLLSGDEAEIHEPTFAPEVKSQLLKLPVLSPKRRRKRGVQNLVVDSEKSVQLERKSDDTFSSRPKLNPSEMEDDSLIFPRVKGLELENGDEYSSNPDPPRQEFKIIQREDDSLKMLSRSESSELDSDDDYLPNPDDDRLKLETNDVREEEPEEDESLKIPSRFDTDDDIMLETDYHKPSSLPYHRRHRRQTFNGDDSSKISFGFEPNEDLPVITDTYYFEPDHIILEDHLSPESLQWPTYSGLSEEEASIICAQTLFDNPLAQACGEYLGESLQLAYDYCLTDIKVLISFSSQF